MVSTAAWNNGELTAQFLAENYSSQVVTGMVTGEMPSIPRHITAFRAVLLVMRVLGILSNGLVLTGFCLAGRSKMNSSSVHIANHTTLERPGRSS